MTPITLPPSLHTSDPDYTRERYSPLQAAAYLGVSLSVVYAEVAAKRIGFRRDQTKRPRAAKRVRATSGRLHFSQADLDQWRQARRHEPARMRMVPSEPSSVLELPAERRFA